MSIRAMTSVDLLDLSPSRIPLWWHRRRRIVAINVPACGTYSCPTSSSSVLMVSALLSETSFTGHLDGGAVDPLDVTRVAPPHVGSGEETCGDADPLHRSSALWCYLSYSTALSFSTVPPLGSVHRSPPPTASSFWVKNGLGLGFEQAA
jgi:hypothetical protein